MSRILADMLWSQEMQAGWNVHQSVSDPQALFFHQLKNRFCFKPAIILTTETSCVPQKKAVQSSEWCNSNLSSTQWPIHRSRIWSHIIDYYFLFVMNSSRNTKGRIQYLLSYCKSSRVHFMLKFLMVDRSWIPDLVGKTNKAVSGWESRVETYQKMIMIQTCTQARRP